MCTTKTTDTVKILAVALALVLFQTGSYAFVNNNGSGSGYGGGGRTAARSGAIEMYVMKGGAFFLAANSDYQIFLNKIELQELQGLDFTELTMHLNSAITNMTAAKDTYALLLREAESLPYDETFITGLKAFDYDAFMLEKKLNETVFKEVGEYLEKGDITGLLRNTYNGFTGITKMLESLRMDISQSGQPELSLIREINETFGELSLAGSYAARIFSVIQKQQ